MKYSSDSFDSIEQWLKELKTNSSPDIKIFLIGNKIDLEENRVVGTEQGKQLVDDYNLDFFTESSARDGTNTEYIFVQAAKLLYNNYVKYKTGNPLIGNIKGNKLKKADVNINSNIDNLLSYSGASKEDKITNDQMIILKKIISSEPVIKKKKKHSKYLFKGNFTISENIKKTKFKEFSFMKSLSK